jgi:hypothetical protein
MLHLLFFIILSSFWSTYYDLPPLNRSRYRVVYWIGNTMGGRYEEEGIHSEADHQKTSGSGSVAKQGETKDS